jgi:hypothetical protein
MYYWPIFASGRFIPQSKAEAAGGKPLKFRAALSGLIKRFETHSAHGGLTAWSLALNSGRLEAGIEVELDGVLGSIAETIRQGPVAFSGGSLDGGPVFRYERAQDGY